LLFDDILASGNRILYSAFSSATDSLVETTGNDGASAALFFFVLATTTTGGFFFAAAMEDEEHSGSGCGVLFLDVGGFFAAFVVLEEHCGSGFGFALGFSASEIAFRESSPKETSGKDGLSATLFFFDLATTTAGGFFFAVAMEDDEHRGSGCGVLFFNVGGFFAALFVLEEPCGSGFGFALGGGAPVANFAVFLLFAVFAEPPFNPTSLVFFTIGDPTCCDVSFVLLVPCKDITLSVLLLVAAVIQMDPMPKWFRNQSFFLDDNAVKDGFRSSAS
jgi:hypothetical protein